MEDLNFFQTHWHFEAVRPAEKFPISGSPNRSVKRFVFHSGQGDFIAEAFELRKKSRQIRQNEILEFLARNRMQGVFSWLRTVDGAHGVAGGGWFWQVRPWCAADPLPRKTLGDEAAFARIWSRVLLELKEFSPAENSDLQMPNENFAFSAYLPVLDRFAREKSADFYPRISQMLKRISPLCRQLDSLPRMFAHGDFHPGNILVRNGNTAAVIDWEFCGWKPAGYDLALLLGCLGMDDPRWLSKGVIVDMQKELFARDYMPRAAWEMLTWTIAATRLGWLGEWIDLNDRRMVEQELTYINDFLLG